jgi:tetratricopeptide (TPR) repeat protein
MAHANLACKLYAQGKLDEVVAANREAIRLKPDNRLAQCNLGGALAELGRLEEGIAAYREAIRLMPHFTTARKNLALLLRQKGDFTGSLAEYRRFREQVANRPDWSDRSTKMVELAERMAALAGRLPGILKGDDRPRDNAERILFARICFDTKRYAAAERLYAEALASDPGLDRKREEFHCFRAACAAAVAAAGWGQDDPSPDDGEKARLRGRALFWLKADLAAWAKVVDSGPTRADLGAWEKVFGAGPQLARGAAFYTLSDWRIDGRLAIVREPEALAKLVEAERKEWKAFWSEVEAMTKRIATAENRSHDLLDENEDIR